MIESLQTNAEKHDGWDKFLMFAIALYELALLIFTTIWLFTNAFAEYKTQFVQLSGLDINETVTYGLFFSGVLGGSFYCLRALYQRLGEAYTPIDGSEPKPRRAFNVKAWSLWYFYRPIQGGVLALILLCLLNSNLVAIKQLSGESLKSYFTLIAVGFLAGFGSHELIHKIQEIIQVTFAKSKLAATNSGEKVKENNGKP